MSEIAYMMFKYFYKCIWCLALNLCIGVNYLHGWCGTAGKTKKREITPWKFTQIGDRRRERGLFNFEWHFVSWGPQPALLSACIHSYTPAFWPFWAPPLSTGWGFRDFFRSWFSPQWEVHDILYSALLFSQGMAWRKSRVRFLARQPCSVVPFAERWGEKSPPPKKKQKIHQKLNKKVPKVFRCGVPGVF